MSSDLHLYFAAAGCGKTSALMQLVKEKLYGKNSTIKSRADFKQLRFISFTKIAAEVTKQRLSKLTGISVHELGPICSTLHSMCFRALGASKAGMMRAEDYTDFGNRAGYNLGQLRTSRIHQEDIDWKDLRDIYLCNADSTYRNNPKTVQERANSDTMARLSRFMALYSSYRQSVNRMDFTDLLEKYLEEGRVEEGVRCVFVDEAQDLTPLQWKVVFQAFRNCTEMHVAGDPNQAIFSFAGGDPSVLVRLKGTPHYLDTSYRVPANILKVATTITSQIPTTERAEFEIHSFIGRNGTFADTKVEEEALKKGHVIKNRAGIIKVVPDLDCVPINPKLSYMMLAANRIRLKRFTTFCERQGIMYSRTGVPVFNFTELRHPEKLAGDRKALYDRMRASGFVPPPSEVFSAQTIEACSANINTIHGVKGDEADVVIIDPDMQPNTYKQSGSAPSELHRLYYVAVTRAKAAVYVLAPKQLGSYLPMVEAIRCL